MSLENGVTASYMPVDMTALKAALSRPQRDHLEQMTSLTVMEEATKAGQSVDAFLNTHTTAEITKAIIKYAKDKSDVIPIIHLVVEDALGALADEKDDIYKYQKQSGLRFEDLLAVKKEPEHAQDKPRDLAKIILSRRLAKQAKPQLALYDPQVRFHPVKEQIMFTSAAELSAQIYQRTNEDDKAALEYQKQQAKKANAEALKRQENHLAYLETAVKTTQADDEELVRAKLKLADLNVSFVART